MDRGTDKIANLETNSFSSNALFNNFAITFAFVVLTWYLKYHWSRRRLYKIAASRKGTWLTLPFVGNGLLFMGSTERILRNIWRFAKDFESASPLWLGPRLFFCIHKPEHMETIMNSPHALAKDDVYKFTLPAIGQGLFSAAVPKWRRNRKIITPTFNQRILDGFVEVFSEQAIILTQQLEKESGKGTFDVFHYMGKFSLDSICETAMGIKVNAQTTNAEFVRWTNTCMEIAYTRIFNVFYHSDFIFNKTQMSKEFYSCCKQLSDFTANVIRTKRLEYRDRVKQNKERPEALFEEGAPKRKTFLEQLIELSEGGERLTDDDLRDEVITLLIGGSDTTSSVNSFTLIMLGMFPDIQEKVYNEVVDAVGLEKAIECADLPHLSYLELVIKETMRLFPVGPVIARSITKDIQLGDAILPAGCSVALIIIETHRNPITWPDPTKFDPYRFLPEKCAKRHPYSYCPFSGGPRNCVGVRYAYMAMKSVIATIVRKYKITTVYKSPEEIKLKADLVLKPCDGYKIALTLRE